MTAFRRGASGDFQSRRRPHSDLSARARVYWPAGSGEGWWRSPRFHAGWNAVVSRCVGRNRQLRSFINVLRVREAAAWKLSSALIFFLFFSLLSAAVF